MSCFACPYSLKKCPMSENTELCCSAIRKSLVNNEFSKQELQDMIEICNLRTKNKKYKPGQEKKAEFIFYAHKTCTNITLKNKSLINDSKIILFALAEKTLSEILPKNSYIMLRSSKIEDLIPWFNSRGVNCFPIGSNFYVERKIENMR